MMKAVSQTERRKVEIIEVPDPVPEPGRVVVDMRMSGICGSDLHFFRRSPDGRKQNPAIRGHEPCGVVSAVGEGVTNVQPGQRVCIYHYECCGYCQDCRQGNWMWCGNRTGRIMGYDRPGSMAEKMLVDARNCFVLPDELAFADGAFIACGAGTTWSALQKVSPRCNDRAVVFGCGPLGLLGVLFLRAYGVETVAVGRRKARLEKAREIGAADVIDIDEGDDPGELLRSRYPGGFSLAYETSGAVTAQQWMIALLSRGGRAAVVGSGPKQPAISLSEIYGKQLSLHGSFVMNAGEYDNLCRFLVSQRTPLETLVSHRFPLAEAQQAFELADSGDCTKVMLDING